MTKKKTSIDLSSKANFAPENNAFAAAVNEAMADDGSLSDDIFESIEFNDKAMEDGEEVSMHSSRVSRSSSSSDVTEHKTFGLPVVKELKCLEDMKGKNTSNLKKKSGGYFKKMVSLPKNMGASTRTGKKSEKSLLSANDEYSIYSEDRARSDKPIPTRQLSRSNPSTWKISKHLLVNDDTDTAVHRSAETTAGFIQQISGAPSKRSAAMKLGDASVSVSSSVGPRSDSAPSLKFLKGYHSAVQQSSSIGIQGSSSYASWPSRPQMLYQESGRSSTSYRVPMPTMPFETNRANIIRIAMAVIFFASSLTFTLFLGKGQLGLTLSSYLYENLIADDESTGTDLGTNGAPETSNGSHLFQTIRELERTHRPNKNGIADYHIPKVIPNGLELEVEVGLKPHPMSKDHFIKYVWLRDIDANSIVLAKEFKPTDESPPVLRAQVPSGVTLQPFIYCNSHQLWKAEPYKVPELN